jgi:hypothetical protein
LAGRRIGFMAIFPSRKARPVYGRQRPQKLSGGRGSVNAATLLIAW